MKESILVTGNKGFIGSRVCSRLMANGFDIRIKGHHEFHEYGDIRKYEAKRKYDVVIHTAALTSVVESMKNPAAYFETNVQGTLNMVQQHPESHFVYLSTAGIYGEGSHHTINSEARPESVYACTKFLGECVIRTFARSYTILRLTNVIGGDKGEPNVYQVFEKSEKLPIYGDGEQTRDFIHVDKVCEVIERACKRTFNVGSGISKTVLEVAREFNKPVEFLPAREGEIKHFGISDAFHTHP